MFGWKRAVGAAVVGSALVTCTALGPADPGAAGAASNSPAASLTVAAGRWTVDDTGRVVLAHGINLVHKLAPYYPVGFSASDAKFLADEGFTSVRLGVLWAGVEPTPGHYDSAYIQHLVDVSDLLNAVGIRTLVDFHQDSWSAKNGGDGAPNWASLGSSADKSFQAFWSDAVASDGVGLEEHFASAWQHVAEAFAGRAGVLGYDVFNEPYPGSGYSFPCGDFSPCPSFETGALTTFYQRMIKSIRSVDARHVVWVESIADNGQQAPSLPGFGPGVAYTFHEYCSPYFYMQQYFTPYGPQVIDQTENVPCPSSEQQALDRYQAYTRQLKVPANLSEFSAADTNTDNARMVDLMGPRLLPWEIWQYYNTEQPGGVTNGGILVDDSKPASEANAKQAKLDAVVVPYPAAIAGIPQSYSYDRQTGTMTFSYRAIAVPGVELNSEVTWLFVPGRKYPHGYCVDITSGRVQHQYGQWLAVAAPHGADVKITITPTS